MVEPGPDRARHWLIGGPGTGRSTALGARARVLATALPTDGGGVLVVCAGAGAARAMEAMVSPRTAGLEVVSATGLVARGWSRTRPSTRVAHPAQVAEAVATVAAAHAARGNPDPELAALAGLWDHRSLGEQVVAAWAELDDGLAHDDASAPALAHLRREVRSQLLARDLVERAHQVELLGRDPRSAAAFGPPPAHVLIDDADRVSPAVLGLLAGLTGGATLTVVAPDRAAAAAACVAWGDRPVDDTGFDDTGFDDSGVGATVTEFAERLRGRPVAELVVGVHPSIEAELAVTELISARRRGVTWDDMAVVCPGGGRSRAALVRAMDRHGIPSNARVALAPTPLGRAWVEAAQAHHQAGDDPDPAEAACAAWEADVASSGLHPSTRAAEPSPDDSALDEIMARSSVLNQEVAMSELGQVRLPIRRRRGGPDSVAVVEAHEVIGREWDTVVVTGCVEAILPDLSLPAPDLLAASAPRRAARWDAQRRVWSDISTRARRRLVAVAAPAPGGLVSRFVVSLPRRDPELAPAPGPPGIRRTPTESVLGQGHGSVMGPGPLALSASALDSYSSCPLKFMFRYGLRARGASGLPAELGSAVHRVLARFLDPEAGRPRTQEALVALAEECWDDGIAPWRAQRHQLRTDYTAMLQRWWEGEGDPATGISPDVVAVEREFSVTVAGHTLRGTIDRIDRLDDGTLGIVDYKTGRYDPDAGTDNLQLACYYLAATNDPHLSGLGPVTLLRLRFLRTMKPSDQAVTADLAARAEATVAAMAEAISAGHFDPLPGQHCRFCDFRRLCPTQSCGRPLGTP